MAGTQTVCYSCESTYEETKLRCDCGEPLWFDTDSLSYSWENVKNELSLWRYEDAIPVGHRIGIGDSVGSSPLIRTKSLDDIVECQTWVKWEGSLPTGAYKDRGSAVSVSHSIELGNEWVGTVSYGNMAMSTAAHAASANVGCIILVPPDMPTQRQPFIAQYEPDIIEVSGDYGQLYYDALALSDSLEVDFLNADPPSRIAGYKTCVYEICDEMRPNIPEAIIAPASAGGLGSGLWKGLQELLLWDMIDFMPRLYFVQTSASDPITQAYEKGHEKVDSLDQEDIEDTIAHSIGNPDPPSGARVLEAAYQTNGAVLSVTDKEIVNSQRLLAREEGICVEPSSATVLAGLHKLSADDEISSDEQAVMVASGTGFKELDSKLLGEPSLKRIQQDELHQTTAKIISDSMS